MECKCKRCHTLYDPDVAVKHRCPKCGLANSYVKIAKTPAVSTKAAKTVEDTALQKEREAAAKSAETRARNLEKSKAQEKAEAEQKAAEQKAILEAEENKRREAQQAEEEARKAEEQRIAEEERRIAAEKRRAEEEKLKLEEEMRIAEEKRKAEEEKARQEEARIAEEQRKAEERRQRELQAQEAKRKAEEKARILEEQEHRAREAEAQMSAIRDAADKLATLVNTKNEQPEDTVAPECPSERTECPFSPETVSSEEIPEINGEAEYEPSDELLFGDADISETMESVIHQMLQDSDFDGFEYENPTIEETIPTFDNENHSEPAFEEPDYEEPDLTTDEEEPVKPEPKRAPSKKQKIEQEEVQPTAEKTRPTSAAELLKQNASKLKTQDKISEDAPAAVKTEEKPVRKNRYAATNRKTSSAYEDNGSSKPAVKEDATPSKPAQETVAPVQQKTSITKDKEEPETSINKPNGSGMDENQKPLNASKPATKKSQQTSNKSDINGKSNDESFLNSVKVRTKKLLAYPVPDKKEDAECDVDFNADGFYDDAVSDVPPEEAKFSFKQFVPFLIWLGVFIFVVYYFITILID